MNDARPWRCHPLYSEFIRWRTAGCPGLVVFGSSHAPDHPDFEPCLFALFCEMSALFEAEEAGKN